MYALVLFNLLSFYPHELRENDFKNTCDFDIIRIKKKDVMCIDYGITLKLCNDKFLSEEFIVTKEIGVGKLETINIRPYAMWEESYNKKYKIADFYYSFYCDKEDNEPRLVLSIVPTKKYDINNVEYTVLFIIFVLVIIFICWISPELAKYNHNTITNGVILSSVLNNNGNKRKYCD